jgi:flagellar basal-body rod protein FlgC
MSIDLYTSVAGINAFFKKMDVTAHNVANLNTDNYKRRIPHVTEDKNGLPETTVAIDHTPGLENPRKAGEPEGTPREMSNVNYAEEAVNMIEAEMGVKANVKALKVAGEMFGSLLDIFV